MYLYLLVFLSILTASVWGVRFTIVSAIEAQDLLGSQSGSRDIMSKDTNTPAPKNPAEEAGKVPGHAESTDATKSSDK